MELLGTISVGFDVTLTNEQIFYICQILEKKKMVVQWDSTSAIHGLQESLWFSEEESTVQYSHRAWGTHETSQAD
jgi:hypothetical protein